MRNMNLRRLVESEVRAGLKRRAAQDLLVEKLIEALVNRKIKPEAFSLKELATVLCGESWVNDLRSPSVSTSELLENRLTEGDDAVNVTGFSNITGQIVYNAIHRGWDNEAFIASGLSSMIPTDLMSEKIPGFQSIRDEALEVHEGQPFNYTGFGESFQITPETKKYGLALGLTKEAIFFDRTGIFVRQADGLGFRLGIRKEKELLNIIIGAVNNYNWRDLQLATYLTVDTGGLWVNDVPGNKLESWRNLDTIKQTFQAIKNPDSGDPILVGGLTMLVTPEFEWTAKRILNATEVRESQASGTSSPFENTETLSPNPLPTMNLVSSQLLLDQILAGVEADAAKAGKYYFVGDFQRAFAYMQNWGMEILRAPNLSEAEFERDIIMRWRASERGVASVFDPRYVVRSFDT